MKQKQKKTLAKKRWIGCTLAICALIILIPLAVSVICFGIVHIGGQKERIYIEQIDSLSPKDMAIVPGTGVYEGTISAKAKDRLLGALQLYEKKQIDRIIISGDTSEVKAMTQYLMLKGVPEEALLSDQQGIDTYETLARIKEKYKEQTYYFCTQELYANRAGYLMKQIGIEGTVICVDTMYYSKAGRNMLREYFASVKAVAEPLLYGGKPKQSIQDKDFITISKPEKDPHILYADDIDPPEDYRIEDKNKEDGYDVIKAVEYARTYALDRNKEYPEFEWNCTNFVSQCLVAGGIETKGELLPSDKERYRISGKSDEWYSTSKITEDGIRHYATSSNFINTDEFIRYFTEERGYEMSVYNNDYQGKIYCHNTVASGDVLILFNGEGDVAHIGLITGIGENNAYFCANTNNKLDFGIFTFNSNQYAQFGILHMSGK